MLDYSYLKKHYKITATDLSKQHPIDADSKAMQQINSARNLSGNNNKYFSLLEKQKNNIKVFDKEQLKYCILILI